MDSKIMTRREAAWREFADPSVPASVSSAKPAQIREWFTALMLHQASLP